MAYSYEDGVSISVDHKPRGNREKHSNRDLDTIEKEMRNRKKNSEDPHVDMDHKIPASFARNLESVSPDGKTFLANELEDEAYRSLFGDAVEEYNAKQTRKDRKTSVEKYHRQIKEQRSTKAKHPQNTAYGMILQTGNVNVHPPRAVQEQILEEAMQKIIEKYSHLYFYNIAIHGDEFRVEPFSEEKIKNLEADEYVVSEDKKSVMILNTIHIHAAYVPFRENCKRGLSRQNGLNEALRADGLKIEKGSGRTLEQEFQLDCRNIIAETMREHGLPVLTQKADRDGHSLSHESDRVYKAKEKQKELQKQNDELKENIKNSYQVKKSLESEIDTLKSQKSDLIALSGNRDELQENVDRLKAEQAGLAELKKVEADEDRTRFEHTSLTIDNAPRIDLKTRNLPKENKMRKEAEEEGKKSVEVVVMKPEDIYRILQEQKRVIEREEKYAENYDRQHLNNLSFVKQEIANAFSNSESGKFKAAAEQQIKDKAADEFEKWKEDYKKEHLQKPDALQRENERLKQENKFLSEDIENQRSRIEDLKEKLRKWTASAKKYKLWYTRIWNAVKTFTNFDPKELYQKQKEAEEAIQQQAEGLNLRPKTERQDKDNQQSRGYSHGGR